MLLCLSVEIDAAEASLPPNPSFETPVQTTLGNHVGTAPSNWTKGGTYNWNLVQVDGSTPYGGGPIFAQQGDQYLDLDATGAAYQNFTLTASRRS